MKIDFEANSVAQRCHNYIGNIALKGRAKWRLEHLFTTHPSWLKEIIDFFGTTYSYVLNEGIGWMNV